MSTKDLPPHIPRVNIRTCIVSENVDTIKDIVARTEPMMPTILQPYLLTKALATGAETYAYNITEYSFLYTQRIALMFY